MSTEIFKNGFKFSSSAATVALVRLSMVRGEQRGGERVRERGRGERVREK
jgi:hypothetical protein